MATLDWSTIEAMNLRQTIKRLAKLLHDPAKYPEPHQSDAVRKETSRATSGLANKQGSIG